MFSSTDGDVVHWDTFSQEVGAPVLDAVGPALQSDEARAETADRHLPTTNRDLEVCRSKPLVYRRGAWAFGQ